MAASYWQIHGWVQVDHQQSRWEPVVGQASVCSHTLQHLCEQQTPRCQRCLLCFRWMFTTRRCTWPNFSGVESRDSHSIFKWSFPVGVSSSSNHWNNGTKHETECYKPGHKVHCWTGCSYSKREDPKAKPTRQNANLSHLMISITK